MEEKVGKASENIPPRCQEPGSMGARSGGWEEGSQESPEACQRVAVAVIVYWVHVGCAFLR